MKKSLTTLARVLSATLCAAALCVAQAQSFPLKPVRIITPFGAGNTLDTALRVMGEKFKESTGQPLVIATRQADQDSLPRKPPQSPRLTATRCCWAAQA